jgi:hypothetical protein
LCKVKVFLVFHPNNLTKKLLSGRKYARKQPFLMIYQLSIINYQLNKERNQRGFLPIALFCFVAERTGFVPSSARATVWEQPHG